MKEISYHIVYLLAICVTLVSCEEEKIVIIEPPYSGPLATVKDVKTLFSDSASVRIKLSAPLQYELMNLNREFPDGFELLFLKKDGTIETRLTGDYGIFYKDKGLYKAKGNVVIKNMESQEQLDSEELYWNPETEMIYTDKFVRIRTKDEILMGNGLEATQDFSKYKILKPTGIFSIKE